MFLGLFVTARLVLGQGVQPDTLQDQSSEPAEKLVDTVKHKFLPTGIYVGFDGIAAVKNFAKPSFKGNEFAASVDVYRYLLSVEVGNWGKTISDSSFNYSNSGKYYRVGVDVDFLTKDVDRNLFFLGFRYGHSTFSEDLDFPVTDAHYGDQQVHFSNDQLKLRWYEVTTGIRVKMWKWLWMGYTAAYRFGLNLPKNTLLTPYDVPGYGATFRTSTWGFAYQLFIRIPVRKFPGPLKIVEKK